MSTTLEVRSGAPTERRVRYLVQTPAPPICGRPRVAVARILEDLAGPDDYPSDNYFRRGVVARYTAEDMAAKQPDEYQIVEGELIP